MTGDAPIVPLLNWSQDQLVRLEYEWRRLQRAFAYHPHVRIVSMRDDPPGEYEIEMKMRTLSVGSGGQLEYAAAVPLRVWLPPGFPSAPPAVRPLIGVFHPNVSWESIHLSTPWQPTETLVELLQKIGELLAWRVYDPQSVVNPLAMQWLEANAAMLPLDTTADFATDAAGHPLERITRHGPATLEQIQQQFEQLRDSLLNRDAPPRPADVRELVRRTRLALNLFLDDDIPSPLRDQAVRLDEWARDLPDSLASWEYLRRQRKNIADVEAASAALRQSTQSLSAQLRTLEELAPSQQPMDTAAAMVTIPALQLLEGVRFAIPAMVSEARQRATALSNHLASLDEQRPESSLSQELPLGRELRERIDSLASSAGTARQSAQSALSAAQPLIERAQNEGETLRRIVTWREYLDLVQTGGELERKIAMWGSAGIHAYYVENETGRFGPYQFEQAIELGHAKVALRMGQGDELELMDAVRATVLSHGGGGSLRWDLPAESQTESISLTFRLTARWEDLVVQFDFLIRQSERLVEQIAASRPIGDSWCGHFLQQLATRQSLHDVREESARATGRWNAILQDLKRLGPLKVRLETWHLLRRTLEAVPRLSRKLFEARQRLDTGREELRRVVARCTTEPETGQLVIPPRLVEAYNRQTELCDRARADIDRRLRMLQTLGAQAAARVEKKGTAAAVPQFAVLAPLPPELAATLAAATDQAIDQQAGRLRELLNRSLRGEELSGQVPLRPPQPTGSASRPAEGAA